MRPVLSCLVQGPGREGNKWRRQTRLSCARHEGQCSGGLRGSFLEGGCELGLRHAAFREVKWGSLNTHCVLVCDQVERTEADD